jgi:hypothetical protein
MGRWYKNYILRFVVFLEPFRFSYIFFFIWATNSKATAWAVFFKTACISKTKRFLLEKNCVFNFYLSSPLLIFFWHAFRGHLYILIDLVLAYLRFKKINCKWKFYIFFVDIQTDCCVYLNIWSSIFICIVDLIFLQKEVLIPILVCQLSVFDI